MKRQNRKSKPQKKAQGPAAKEQAQKPVSRRDMLVNALIYAGGAAVLGGGGWYVFDIVAAEAKESDLEILTQLSSAVVAFNCKASRSRNRSSQMQAREHAELTTAQLARRLGVQTKTMNGWEKGESEPRSNRAVNLAGVLNVSVTWLLTGQGDQVQRAAPKDELIQIRTQIEDVQASLERLSETMGYLAQRVADLENRE